MSKSQIRQNYHEENEAGVNKQINMELYASYVYAAMVSRILQIVIRKPFHFDRDDVALANISKFFKESSDEEKEHAFKLMKFQNQRGGTVLLKDIKAPTKQKWATPLEAMQDALELEKTVNQSLLDLHKVASSHDDAQMCDFLESEYLTEQVEAIKKIADYVTNLKRVGNGLGEYIFDKEFK
ncbi:soma ferritin [Trichonephila inaurata madagascariensis]|uniref:Ferritin n=1 Tax=Trichonephila inaurata madagascariensis TaxID=2747483 RepID=A0A8X6YWM6_9ARAC|nr:soma ferritin [Trichonephila inaurata madagascariensis]